MGLLGRRRTHSFQPFFSGLSKRGYYLDLFDLRTLSSVWDILGGDDGVNTPLRRQGDTVYLFSLGMKEDKSSQIGESRGSLHCETNLPHRILLVDDEESVRQLNSITLIRSGYEVDSAADGAAGWEALQAKHYDLLITDNSMPKVTGVEMVEMLRSARMPVAIIMATGAIPDHELTRHPWLRSIAMMTKPFTADELLSTVRKVLSATDGEDYKDSSRAERQPLPAKNSNHIVVRNEAEAKMNPEVNEPVHDVRSEQAEARAEQAEARAERTEKRSEETLHASELRYRRLFEAAQDGILILEVDTGRITDVNPFLVELLGFSINEMVGKTVAEVSPFKDIESNQDMLRRLQEHGYVRYENLPLQTRDKRRIAVEFVSNVYQAGDKKVIQCNIRDITKRKHAEDEMRRFNAKLEQRVAERTVELEAFSCSVSHDLRAPLRHVVGFVKQLQEEAGPSLSEKSFGDLTAISKTTKRMGDLIDDLLTFSRIGQSEMKKTDVNLDELVRDTLSDFQAETKERHIEWDLHPLPSVQADRALLRLVFVNLISNALKFTGTRTEPKIEIGCAPIGTSEFVIFVRDNGAGFDPKYSHKLFSVFQRLHGQDEFEGTGLGLANVQRIINRHGGRAWAEGGVDAGATFYFAIPK